MPFFIALVVCLVGTLSVPSEPCAANVRLSQGEEVTSHHPNGKKSERKTVLVEPNGEAVAHGPYASWHDNGKKSEKGQYESGLREGKWQGWHPNGKKRFIGSYVAGRKHGSWRTWFQDGALSEKGRYENGVPTEEWSAWLSKDKKDAARSGIYSVQEVALFDGAITGRGAQLNDRPWGAWSFYWSNGIPFLEGEYAAGDPVGPWVLRHPDGSVEWDWVTGVYAGGKRRDFLGADAAYPRPPRSGESVLLPTHGIRQPEILQEWRASKDDMALLQRFDAKAKSYGDRAELAGEFLAAWGKASDSEKGPWAERLAFAMDGKLEKERHLQLLSYLGRGVLQSLSSPDSSKEHLVLSLMRWRMQGAPIGVDRRKEARSKAQKSEGKFGVRFRLPANVTDPIERGQAWLRESQRESGLWVGGDPRLQVGLTSRALLALEAYSSDKHQGARSEEVLRGQFALRQLQDPVDGAFLSKELQSRPDVAPILQHALATQALAKVWCSLGKDKVLERPLRKAIQWLLEQRGSNGAFPRSVGGVQDPVTTAIALFALVTVKERLLLDFDLSPTYEWLQAETRGSRPGPVPSRFGAFEESRDIVNAILILCNALDADFHLAPTDSMARLDSIGRSLKATGKGTAPGDSTAPHLRMYAAHAAFVLGGRAWRDWSQWLLPDWQKSLIQKSLIKGGADSGYWTFEGKLDSDLDEVSEKILATSLGVLACEVYLLSSALR